jgi:hypothetical protein
MMPIKEDQRCRASSSSPRPGSPVAVAVGGAVTVAVRVVHVGRVDSVKAGRIVVAAAAAAKKKGLEAGRKMYKQLRKKRGLKEKKKKTKEKKRE